MGQADSEDCCCATTRNRHTIVYEPGAAEAIVACVDCGRLWYTILFERMGFGRDDTLETYEIPITDEESQQLRASGSKQPDLGFLRGRRARVLFDHKTVEVTSDRALSRCGR